MTVAADMRGTPACRADSITIWYTIRRTEEQRMATTPSKPKPLSTCLCGSTDFDETPLRSDEHNHGGR